MSAPEPADVRANGAPLPRALSLRDLVLAQIVLIVGPTWVGTAGKLGSSHVYFWLAAGLLFFVPLAVVVVHLSERMPLEGGLYQWAKLGFGRPWGFLVAWNTALYVVVFVASLGLETATFLSYAMRPHTAWMASNKPVILGLSAVIIVGLAASAWAGMRIGKWVHNAGGALRLVMYATLIALPLAVGDALHPPSAVSAAAAASSDGASTAFSLTTMNLLAKMGFGAFSGFEYIAIFAGETRAPATTIRRSVVIAAPLVLAIFVLGTNGVLSFTAPADIDLIAPVLQALSAGTSQLGAARWLVPFMAIAIVVESLAWGSTAFAGLVRLPMVAGWDGLLPARFARLHPTRATPTLSIVVALAVTLALAVLGTWGASHQEAYQLFQSAAFVFYALAYLVMFALAIRGAPDAAGARPKTSPLVRVAAASGFGMTLLFLVLAVFPIIDVPSPFAFGVKVAAVVVVANGVGLALYFGAGSGRRARATSASP